MLYKIIDKMYMSGKDIETYEQSLKEVKYRWLYYYAINIINKKVNKTVSDTIIITTIELQ